MGEVADALREVSDSISFVRASARNLLAGDVDLIDPGDFAGFFPEQLESNMLVEVLHLLMPLIAV